MAVALRKSVVIVPFAFHHNGFCQQFLVLLHQSFLYRTLRVLLGVKRTNYCFRACLERFAGCAGRWSISAHSRQAGTKNREEKDRLPTSEMATGAPADACLVVH